MDLNAIRQAAHTPGDTDLSGAVLLYLRALPDVYFRGSVGELDDNRLRYIN